MNNLSEDLTAEGRYAEAESSLRDLVDIDPPHPAA
jgi:hypothetical protein